MNTSDVMQALAKASQGLLFPSETDSPFEVFEWSGEQGKPDKARVLARAGLPPEASVTVKGLDTFFRDVTKEQDWHNDTEKAEVQRFKQLVEILKKSLTDVKVFQVGTVESVVYVVGRTGTSWVGLKTKVVET